jgi:death-on-curing protein
VIYLSSKQILFIHARVVAETGGSHGVRDLGLLAAAVARPQASFDGSDLYPDAFSKAAALMESLLKNHPFLDGNKRTAFASAGVFLRLNGFKLTATSKDSEAKTLDLIDDQVTVEQLASWFKLNTAS